MNTDRRALMRATFAALALAAACAPVASAQTLAATGNDTATTAPDQWARQVWQAASAGTEQRLFELLWAVPTLEQPAALASLRESIHTLEHNIERREELRREQMDEARTQLAEHLAGQDTVALSKALLAALRLHMLATDPAAILAEPEIQQLVQRAESAAHQAERDGQVLIAAELFQRLDALFEQAGTYTPDADRVLRRLAMIRLYAPERFWTMRNERRIAEGEDPLPPYNGLGDDYRTRLAGISDRMILRAIDRAARYNVDRASLAVLLTGGLEALRTLATTAVLQEVFPGLANDQARAQFLATIDEQLRAIGNGEGVIRGRELDTLDRVLHRVLEASQRTVQVPPAALLHEFGNGAMARLDPFSGIIWPDEVEQFRRSTQASFVGVGIQIRMDELSRIEVVTPLDQTPALRAGIRPGDFITKVNGQSTLGFSLDQAVEVITGPPGTTVVLTVERADADGQKREIDVPLVREQIPLRTVTGWRRIGPGEHEWDWFIDRENGIGYVRLKNFSEKTQLEFDEAVAQMTAVGLNGLILDLRHNPGGLLEQAVSIANQFIDVDRGLIVATQDADRVEQDRQVARRRLAHLARLPVAILINEGSASASEIVAGAVQYYAQHGDARAVLVGRRTFGKGSVQNVWQLPGSPDAFVKVTTQYFKLPGDRIIHRRPGAEVWGVDPDVEVEMLPSQVSEAFQLRQEADVVRLAIDGPLASDEHTEPEELIRGGSDLQLHTALVLLQTRALDNPDAWVTIDN